LSLLLALEIRLNEDDDGGDGDDGDDDVVVELFE